jgi:Ca2+-binding RTX toxin-like protein
MSTQIINRLEKNTVNISDKDSSLTITKQGSILTYDDRAITIAPDSSNNAVTVDGTVWAANAEAIFSEGSTTHVMIGVQGTVGGLNPFNLLGDHALIENSGHITSYNDDFLLNGDDTTIKNSGIITGNDGITVFGDGLTFLNGEDAYLFGQVTAIGLASTDTKSIARITNHGTIEGLNAAILGAIEKDIIVNDGAIIGNVNLGEGSDSYNGSGGTVDGTVSGGAGDDLYIVGDSKTKVIELDGQGTDTVKAGATFTLGVFFEDLILTGKENINGTGNNDDNDLAGNKGNNKLNGKDGADTIFGHGGNDTSTGGAGADTFVFGSGDGKDVILDFESGIDKIDVSNWAGIANFSDLKNHHIKTDGDNLILFSGLDQITIEHFHKADLDGGDFTF